MIDTGVGKIWNKYCFTPFKGSVYKFLKVTVKRNVYAINSFTFNSSLSFFSNTNDTV